MSWWWRSSYIKGTGPARDPDITLPLVLANLITTARIIGWSGTEVLDFTQNFSETTVLKQKYRLFPDANLTPQVFNCPNRPVTENTYIFKVARGYVNITGNMLQVSTFCRKIAQVVAITKRCRFLIKRHPICRSGN